MTQKYLHKTMFAGGTVLAVLLTLELLLQAAYWLSPKVQFHLSLPGTIKVVDDPRLGWRPHPGLPDHDRHGFRNPVVPNRADIVTLGDSQTYGYSVAAHEAWPRLLGQVTGTQTYNMAYGGYGPAHSLALWDEAMQRRPRVVIEAIYSGNDLFDAFQLVYLYNQLPELKSTQPEIARAIRRAEQTQSLEDTIGPVYWMGHAPQPPETTVSPLRQWVSGHCRLYGLARAVKYAADRAFADPDNQAITWESQKQFAAEHQPYCLAYDDGKNRTLMTPLVFVYSMDLDDPRIAEGHRIVLRANRIMAQKAHAAGVSYLAVLIPTKELVFKDAAARAGVDMPIDYHRAIANEQRMWHATKQFLQEHNIPFVDTLDALREQLAAGQQPFHISLDTHINAQGHQAVARLVQTQLDNLHLLTDQTRLASQP